MTEETKFMLGAIVSPQDDRDYLAEAIFPPSDSDVVPDTLDLRPKLPAIRNQGKYGTCAAQTAACIKEYQENVDVGIKTHMSPQFVYNLRSNYPQSGMYGRDVMAILLKNGCCLESTYAYETQHVAAQIPVKAKDEAIKYKIQSYAQVNTVDALKVALYKNGPCYISLPCYNYGGSFWKPANSTEKQIGGHAVTVVGYDKKGFILRNSWGDKWVDKGYTMYPYGDFGMHFEIWTTIDDKSPVPLPPRSLCKCTLI